MSSKKRWLGAALAAGILGYVSFAWAVSYGPIQPNYVMAGPSSGPSPAVPVGRVLVHADIPNYPVVSKTANYTATALDQVILCDASGGAFQITLPSAVGAQKGNFYQIIKTDSSANAVTVGTTSAQTINGSASATLNSQYHTLNVVSDGSNWKIIARVVPLTAPASNWLTGFSTLGYPTYSQPAASDLSNGTTGSGSVVLATGPTIAGNTLMGGSAIEVPIQIVGDPTSGRNIVFGNGTIPTSGFGGVGSRYSGGDVFLSFNSYQNTNNTDKWTQPGQTRRSMKLSLTDNGSGTGLGMQLFTAAAASADAINSTFWGSSIFSVDHSGNLATNGTLTAVGQLITQPVSGGNALLMQPSDAYSTAQNLGINFNPMYNSSNTRTTVAGIKYSRPTTTDGNYDGQIELQTRVTGGSLTTALTLDKNQNATFAGSVSAATTVKQNGLQDTVSAGTGERVERALISGGGSCTITTQSGTWLASTTHNSAGDCTLTITASVFSARPMCVAMVEAANATINSGQTKLSTTTTPSATVIRITTTNSSGTLTDLDFDVICMGPR